MKKILIFANSDIGLFKFRKELLLELSKNYEIHISVPKGEFTYNFEKLGYILHHTQIDRRGINIINDLKLLLSYKKIVKFIKPDIIITYTIKPNIYGGLVARLSKVKYFINITGLGTAFQKKGILRSVIIKLYKSAVKKASRVFFENTENKDIFVMNKILKDKNCFVVAGAGVNLNEFEYTPMKHDSKTTFLFIGRIMKEKGIDELLYAAERIKKKYENTSFILIGGMEDNYSNKIEKYSKKGYIEYLGMQSDVQPFIKNSDCVILPSYHEGMSNALLESAAIGRPIITSNISGCKEVIVDKISGFLVNAKDSIDLYNKIEQYVKLPISDRDGMSLEARKNMVEKFDREKIVDQTINIINY